MGIVLLLLLLFVLYMIIYFAVKHAIDDSKTGQELRAYLSKSVPDSAGERSSPFHSTLVVESENIGNDASEEELEQCPACGHSVSERDAECPSCGLALRDE